jgi:membrane glycosyltransferase
MRVEPRLIQEAGFADPASPQDPWPRASIVETPRHGPTVTVLSLALSMTLAIVAAFVTSLTAWTPAAMIALPLVTVTAIWISGGAATALLGLVLPDTHSRRLPAQWRPTTRTALLITVCNEDPRPLAAHLAALRDSLARIGLGETVQIFVLSDTSGRENIAREEAALLTAQAAGVLTYRRRAENTGRKPGNIGDWVDSHGAHFDHMLVLDADSRVSAHRVARMIRRMEQEPDLGLLQAGIGILRGRTRFGRHQRVASRLLSRGFGRGLAAWSGRSGNYWGHNAIMRVAAFRNARSLPHLSGAAPWGGMILSHDFVEAAWIRRAGWAVALDPDIGGSAEEAPQTIDAFHARDRRWCQGNLQHLRLLFEPGLMPTSRVHLAMGVLSYLVAPIWLILVVLVAFGGVPVSGGLPLIVVAGVLLTPKLCALLERWQAARTLRRRAVMLRASLGELAVSTLIAPLVMLRQARSVLAVCLGRDCGWKSGEGAGRMLRPGLGEASVGWALVALAVPLAGPAAIWLAPVALPLCCAPLVMRVMDAPA